jgi:hypothetical protein
MESGNPPVSTPPPATDSKGWRLVLQIAVLIFTVPAVIWGVFVVFTAAFPAPCGDFSGAAALGAAAAWLIDLPVGLLTLGVGVFVTRGSPSLRKACIGLSLLTLVLPNIATALLQHSPCH